MNQNNQNNFILKVILATLIIIFVVFAGYYLVTVKRQSKNLISQEMEQEELKTIQSVKIDMGTTAFGDWSYQKFNTWYDVSFSLYLPEDFTVDFLDKLKFEVGEGIATITVPQKDKLTSRKIDLVDDKWFSLAAYFDVNLGSMTLDEWIEFFAEHQGFSKEEIISEDITMINKNIKGKVVMLRGISQPTWYVVSFDDHIAFFTGGQDPGTDTDLAKRVVSTLKAN